jgi:hypothetical protein
VWKELTRIVSTQEVWRKSEVWLNREAKRLGGGDEVVSMKRAITLLSSIGWDAPVLAPGSFTTTTEFSKLLRNEWISDDLINMMMEDLSFRARTNPNIASNIKIGTVPLSQAIVRAAVNRTYTKRSVPLLYRYECAVTSSECSQLYFPAHVHGNHWIAIKVDFKKRDISYGIELFCNRTNGFKLTSSLTGDSLEDMIPPPTEFIKNLQLWLQTRFGGPFRLGAKLKHRKQNDGHSCGICTANTIAAAVLGENIWTSKRSTIERAEWFSKLVTRHLNDVSTSDMISEIIR